MKKELYLIAALFLLVMQASPAEAGYKRTPWGSNTWTGPGRPPHWSPRAPRSQLPVKPGRPVDPQWGVSPPGNGSRKGGGFWQDKHKRWYYHTFRRPGYIYYQKPATETVIIEREKIVPVFVPVRPKPSRLQCGGRTITRSDQQTGELIIEYVTGSQDCP